MATVDEVLTRERRDDRPALVDASGRVYDRHWLCTSAWKAGNFLRHTGVRRGVTVGVVGDGPRALLSFLGTALLEGRTWFDPPTDLTDAPSIRTLVAPAADLDRYALPTGTQRVCYGDEPTAPDVHHLDAGLWSENPSFPPTAIEPDTPLLGPVGRADRSVSHAEAMRAVTDLVDEYDLESGTRVGVTGSFADPRVIVAGVLAPLVADGVLVLGEDRSAATVDLLVTDGTEERYSIPTLPLEAVSL